MEQIGWLLITGTKCLEMLIRPHILLLFRAWKEYKKQPIVEQSIYTHATWSVWIYCPVLNFCTIDIYICNRFSTWRSKGIMRFLKICGLSWPLQVTKVYLLPNLRRLFQEIQQGWLGRTFITSPIKLWGWRNGCQYLIIITQILPLKSQWKSTL